MCAETGGVAAATTTRRRRAGSRERPAPASGGAGDRSGCDRRHPSGPRSAATGERRMRRPRARPTRRHRVPLGSRVRGGRVRSRQGATRTLQRRTRERGTDPVNEDHRPVTAPLHVRPHCPLSACGRRHVREWAVSPQIRSSGGRATVNRPVPDSRAPQRRPRAETLPGPGGGERCRRGRPRRGSRALPALEVAAPRCGRRRGVLTARVCPHLPTMRRANLTDPDLGASLPGPPGTLV